MGGAASCKWLTEITVLDKPAEGNFMSPGYRMPNAPVKPDEAVKPEDTHSVTGLTVKSLIAAPSDTAKLRPGKQEIKGVAWAGEADITKVEISTDGGSSWNLTELERTMPSTRGVSELRLEAGQERRLCDSLASHRQPRSHSA